MWKLASSLKRACAGVEIARRPCRYSEHRPNVGRVYILRKCMVRAMSPKRVTWHLTVVLIRRWGWKLFQSIVLTGVPAAGLLIRNHHARATGRLPDGGGSHL